MDGTFSGDISKAAGVTPAHSADYFKFTKCVYFEQRQAYQLIIDNG